MSGLRYMFQFVAEASESKEKLLGFLNRVRTKAGDLGFHAKVIYEIWNNSQKRLRISHYTRVAIPCVNPALKGLKRVCSSDAFNFDPQKGTCALWPKEGLLLLLSEEEGCGPWVGFGFMKWPSFVRNSHGTPVASTVVLERWMFRNFLTSPDPRYREIVKMFAEAGYLEAALDEFNLPQTTLRCPTCGSDVSKVLAAHAGSTKSQAKAEAARRNGKLGGRPKKKTTPE